MIGRIVRRRRRGPYGRDNVFEACCKLLGVSKTEVRSDERAYRTVLAREAIVGALSELLPLAARLSYPEMTSLIGKSRLHTTAFDQYMRFKKWPSVLRWLWLDRVRDELDNKMTESEDEWFSKPIPCACEGGHNADVEHMDDQPVATIGLTAPTEDLRQALRDAQAAGATCVRTAAGDIAIRTWLDNPPPWAKRMAYGFTQVGVKDDLGDDNFAGRLVVFGSAPGHPILDFQTFLSATQSVSRHAKSYATA